MRLTKLLKSYGRKTKDSQVSSQTRSRLADKLVKGHCLRGEFAMCKYLLFGGISVRSAAPCDNAVSPPGDESTWDA
jgi:hypothetical protein